MDREKQFNKFERGQVTVLRKESLTWGEIGRRIQNKRETWKRFFEDQKDCGKNRKL